MPKSKSLPPQTIKDSSREQSKMDPEPIIVDPTYKGSEKLHGKAAIISGGDSGIGRSVSIYFAKEGADISVVYFDSDVDAEETRRMIEEENRKCILIKGDIGDEEFCKIAVEETVRSFGKLDILVNNAAEQHPKSSIEEITAKQLIQTFSTNIFGYFYMTKHALPFLKEGSAIINTTSVTAYRGSDELLDYSSTKGAIVAFTRSLSQSVIKKGIRVNAVAPGPIWTPLIPKTFPPKKVKSFGQQVPMGRVGQPSEVAPSFVFLASNDSSYMSGQVLHPNGGEMVES